MPSKAWMVRLSIAGAAAGFFLGGGPQMVRDLARLILE